ncbi:hypothetical protein ACFYYR_08440 [Streptomyces sp. NPDC001922]|uniref:hypothetical protein n=1 Tax=Streptomyces sp. NPDC001922 TaxID=3364624 RepID=UPI00369D5BD1
MRYLRTHPIVGWLLSVYAITFLLGVAPSYITPLMVTREFGTEKWLLTMLELAFSGGLLLGGGLMSTVLVRYGRMWLIMVAANGFGVVTVAMGLSTNLWVLYGFMFAFGLLAPLLSTPFTTLIQERVEPGVHGRVFSYVSIVSALATPVSIVVFGPLADLVGVQVLLIIAGLTTIAVMAVAIRLPAGRATVAAARVPEPPRVLGSEPMSQNAMPRSAMPRKSAPKANSDPGMPYPGKGE